MLDTRISSQKPSARAQGLRIPHATPSPFGPGRRYLEFSSRHDDRSRFPGQAKAPPRPHERSTYPLHDFIQRQHLAVPTTGPGQTKSRSGTT